jgi:transcriptional regulator with XRE-family HTH domain
MALDIGTSIRAIRKRKGITIPQLCEATGLSKGFISNVENNKTSPSIATLETIANYLNVPVAYFLLSRSERLEIIRKEERQVRTLASGKIEYLTKEGPLRMMIVEMPPGSSTGENHSHAGREVHYILSGKLYVEFGHESAYLEAGDTFSWNAVVPHVVKNVGDETAVLLIAIYNENPDSFL